MTQPSNITPAARTIQLADQNFPAVMRVVSTRFFPEPKKEETRTVGCPHCQKPIVIPAPAERKEDAPITWIVGVDHPIIPDMLVIRMFRVDGDIIVYTVKKDQTSGMRHTLPECTVLFVDETMPPEVFAEQLRFSEEDVIDDGDDEEDDEPENFDQPVTPQTTSPNSQNAS